MKRKNEKSNFKNLLAEENLTLLQKILILRPLHKALAQEYQKIGKK